MTQLCDTRDEQSDSVHDPTLFFPNDHQAKSESLCEHSQPCVNKQYVQLELLQSAHEGTRECCATLAVGAEAKLVLTEKDVWRLRSAGPEAFFRALAVLAPADPLVLCADLEVSDPEHRAALSTRIARVLSS